mgnify:FL=1|jgi:hypothetical protein
MNTKNVLYASILAGLGMVTLASCDKIKDAVEVDLKATSSNISFIIPILEEPGNATLGESKVYLNVDSLIKAHESKLGSDNIRTVKLEKCTITIVDGDSVNNFGALESCKIQFSSQGKPEMVTITELTNNPDEETHTLELPVTDKELSGYFDSKWFNYVVSGKARRATTKTMECKATVTYTITAGL